MAFVTTPGPLMMSFPTDVRGVPSDTFPVVITVPLVTIKTPTELLLALPICVVRLLFAALRVPPAQTTVDVAPPSAIRNRPVMDSEDEPAFSVTAPAVFENVMKPTVVGALTLTV